MENIFEVISKRVELKKAGRNWIGLCPFHSETDPSFCVDEKKQTWHCFGCGIGGDLEAFQERYEQFKGR